MVLSRETRFAAGLTHLDEFISEHGHADVPHRYRCEDGFTLGRWVHDCRSRRRAGRGTPTADQVRQLDERGFDWMLGSRTERTFAVGLKHLDAFIAEHDHANVPYDFRCEDGYNLGTWVASRRAARQAGAPAPTPDQIRQLDERGFDWNPGHVGESERAFAVGLKRLDAFIAEHVHTNVPYEYRCEDGYNLGRWVASRRAARRAGGLTPTADQVRQLDERGFDWNPTARAQREREFAEGLAHVEEFVAEHGHANVPVRYRSKDGFNLGAWVNGRG